jgi:hypothetical protein
MADGHEPLPPRWMAWLLGAVALGLVVVLVIAVHALATANAPVCNTVFPARRGDYPSWAYVLGTIAAFITGSITGQVRIRGQRRSLMALGEGPWADRRAVVAVNLGVAAVLFVITILLVIEAWTLEHGAWPITYYVRCSMDAGALISLIGVVGYALVVGRWMWVFGE